MIKFLRENWIFLLPLIIILLLQINSRELVKWYFQNYEKPRLLNQAYPDSEVFQTSYDEPVAKNYAPKSFDFVIVNKISFPEIVETYFSHSGNSTSIRSRNGKWESTSTECLSVQRQLLFSKIGFWFGAIAVVLNSFRTKQWFLWPGRALPKFNRTESILLVYSVPMFVGNMFIPFTSCNS